MVFGWMADGEIRDGNEQPKGQSGGMQFGNDTMSRETEKGKSIARRFGGTVFFFIYQLVGFA